MGRSKNGEPLRDSTSKNIELGSAFKQLTVFNAHTGWIVDQSGSVQELSGADLESEITSAYLASFSHFFPDRLPGQIEYLNEEQNSHWTE